ncbi:uncharacterized protein MKZ38_001507 [Zalerion maritima]|uniref:Uncharacterized protein n=1 Tax=Zalerion maritima TaxID=339359 RepID=A0AAD5REW6_9PEZI|nr:uncharacterized protein MKZ38_001507 [Zalerion maritima]
MVSPPTTPSSSMKTATRNSNAPTIINIPPPPSHPDTPEPGTPTSTTTSLSAVSTVAIKDGHRGHGLQARRGHAHQNSTNSLDAERADRISRLAGLERVSTLRAPPPQVHHPSNPNTNNSNGYYLNGSANTTSPNPQPMPTSTAGFYSTAGHNGVHTPQHGQQTHQHHVNGGGGGGINGGFISNLPNAFFDANGQPTVHNKMSTVGSASATSGGTAPSAGGRTFTASSSTEGENNEEQEGTLPDRDDDMLSMDTNLQSIGNHSVGDAMDQEEDIRSRGDGGMFDDRMSDDGTASLVGFGEGANSTVSGPIYQRRPGPSVSAATAAAAAAATAAGMNSWVGGVERSSSGLSEQAMLARREREREIRGGWGEFSASNLGTSNGVGASGGGADTPMSMSMMSMVARDGRMAADGGAGMSRSSSDLHQPQLPHHYPSEEEGAGGVGGAGGGGYYETAGANANAVHGTTGDPAHSTPGSRPPFPPGPGGNPTIRETAELIMRERLDHGESVSSSGGPAMTSPGASQRLGQFYFEDRK